MARDTVSLGGGVSDSGTSYILSVSSGSDVTSMWNTPSTYLSGGYTSGTTASTVRAAVITNLQLRLGGTYNGYSGSADGKLQISNNAAGTTGDLLYTTFNQTGTTKTFSSGTINHKIDTSNDYYYGADMNDPTGSVFMFARGGSGNVYLDGTAQPSFSGTSLSGSLTYQTIPSKPQSISATSILQTSLTLNWTAPVDDGVQDPSGYSAANIKGYRISYKPSSSSTWLVYGSGNTGSSATTASITGLSTNTQYDFQVSALNDVTNVYAATTPYTDIAAVVGERSSILTVKTLSSAPKVWNGTAFVPTTLNVWNGAAFVPADIKVWNGSAFVPLIL